MGLIFNHEKYHFLLELLSYVYGVNFIINELRAQFGAENK